MRFALCALYINPLERFHNYVNDQLWDGPNRLDTLSMSLCANCKCFLFCICYVFFHFISIRLIFFHGCCCCCCCCWCWWCCFSFFAVHYCCGCHCLKVSCIFKQTMNSWQKQYAVRSFKMPHNKTTNSLNRRQLSIIFLLMLCLSLTHTQWQWKHHYVWKWWKRHQIYRIQSKLRGKWKAVRSKKKDKRKEKIKRQLKSEWNWIFDG